jgi:hypothetical protein
VRSYVEATFVVDQCVVGDQHWLKFPGLMFDDRVREANDSILGAVALATAAFVICEWVPIVGLFPRELQSICTARGRQYTQLVLNADSSVLRHRKLARDGDCDTAGAELELIPSQLDCLIVDSGMCDVGAMCAAVDRWLGSAAPERRRPENRTGSHRS